MDMGGARRKVNPGIPEDMVMEILIRLPGKQVGRCKCVCKSWRSMIGTAVFKDAYGTRHRGLILYRFEPHTARDLNIYYSPISDKLHEELEFSRLKKLRFNKFHKSFSKIHKSFTRVVNGLTCVDYYADGGWLSIYNVCTGESMRVPDHLADEDEQPGFHLGFDAASRRYKLLRLKYCGNHVFPDCAHIMTLRPSSSTSSEWEPMKLGPGDYIPRKYMSRERKITPNDGFVCWFLPENDLVLFDFSKEKFHKISVPWEFVFRVMYSSQEGFVRAEFMEGQQRLAVSLWTISRRWSAQKRMVCKLLECFVMEDVEGESWTEHFIDFPLLDGDKEVFAVSATSGTEMVVINSAVNEVYCYEKTNKMKEFRVGKQPDYSITTYDGEPPRGPKYYAPYSSTLSCLCDANHLYLPLDDILSP